VEQSASLGSATNPASYFQQSQPPIPESPGRPAPPPHSNSNPNIHRKPVGDNPAPLGQTTSSMENMRGPPMQSSPVRQGSPNKSRMDANFMGMPMQGQIYPPQSSAYGQQHQGQFGQQNPYMPNGQAMQPRSNPTSPPLLAPVRQLQHARSATHLGERQGSPPFQMQQQLPLGQPRPPPHGMQGPLSPNSRPSPGPGSPHSMPNGVPGVQGLPPQSVMYGGQIMPVEAALAMKKRDHRMYGPQHVMAMERMAHNAGFTRGPHQQQQVSPSKPKNEWI